MERLGLLYLGRAKTPLGQSACLTWYSELPYGQEEPRQQNKINTQTYEETKKFLKSLSFYKSFNEHGMEYQFPFILGKERK